MSAMNNALVGVNAGVGPGPEQVIFTMTAGISGSESGFSVAAPAIGSLDVDDAWQGVVIEQILFDDANPDFLQIRFANQFIPGNFFGTIQIVGAGWDVTLENGDTLGGGDLAAWKINVGQDDVEIVYNNDVEPHAAFTASDYTITITALPQADVVIAMTAGVSGTNSGFNAGSYGSVDSDVLQGATLVQIDFSTVTDNLDVEFNADAAAGTQQLKNFFLELKIVGTNWDVTLKSHDAGLTQGAQARWRFTIAAHVAFVNTDVYTCTFRLIPTSVTRTITAGVISAPENGFEAGTAGSIDDNTFQGDTINILTHEGPGGNDTVDFELDGDDVGRDFFTGMRIVGLNWDVTLAVIDADYSAPGTQSVWQWTLVHSLLVDTEQYVITLFF